MTLFPTSDYSGVMEIPGNRITQKAIRMMEFRNAFVGSFCEDRRVLEVACEAGHGLGMLGTKVPLVIGGDFTADLLRKAKGHCDRRFFLPCFDAHSAPFREGGFDVVICYKALRYFPQLEKFVKECRRVLGAHGVLIPCTANKEQPDFHPSPYRVRCDSAKKLGHLLRSQDFEAELLGAFPLSTDTLRDRLVSWVKRAAVRLNLIPKTMKGKEFLKRFFLRRFVEMPSELLAGDGGTLLGEFLPLRPPDASHYEVLSAVGRVR